MKERILLYAEQQRIEEENESMKNSEEKFDPVSSWATSCRSLPF